MSDTTSSGELLLVFCTFPNADDAGLTAHALVGEDLAACVNMVRDIRSIYRWNGEIVNSSEVLCIIKTQRARHAELLKRLAELHPYDVPEMVTVAPRDVNDPYLRWVLQETDPNRPATPEV
jgi:periplasmic divalent cation tolerance protein